MFKIAKLSLMLVLISSCATLQVQKSRVTAAKKVAIVGYVGRLSLDDGKKKEGLAATIGAVKGANDLFSGKQQARRVEQAEAGYAQLTQRLAGTFGMEIIPPTGLAASATLGTLLQKTPNAGLMSVGLQYVPPVPRSEVITLASAETRKAIAAELGVDALAAVNIRYEVGRTGGFSVGGMGKTTTYPRAVVSFVVYDAAGQEVWNDRFARGQVTEEGLATTMGADIVTNENEVLGSALSTAYDTLFANYQAAQ